MKKLMLIALVLALALGLSTGVAFANTQIWTSVNNPNGTTYYHQEMEIPIIEIWGFDIPGGTNFSETIFNAGSIELDAWTATDDDNALVEIKELEASGFTQICKDVTVRPTLEIEWCGWWPSIEVQPTQVRAVIDVETSGVIEGVDLNTYTYMDSWGDLFDPFSLEFRAITDEDIYLHEKVGINSYLEPCIPEIPEYPPCPEDPCPDPEPEPC